jgi:hypothetical protein
VTVTVARAEREPTVAVTVPEPVLRPAVNVTGLPVVGEKVPSAGETVHDGETETAFP